MGHIRDRWRDKSRPRTDNRWQVKFRVDGRERDGGSYKVKAVAERRLRDLETAVERGQVTDLDSRTTLVEACRAHVAIRPVGEGTRKRMNSTIDNHIIGSALGDKRLGKVRPSEAQAWVTDRSRVVAAGTVRTMVTFVRSVYRAAIADGLVTSSPFENVVIADDEQERVVPPTIEDVARLADAMAGDQRRYRAMVLTQAGLGLRLGELLALRVEDVDFLRRTARVEHQISQHTGERAAPKTRRSRRTIPLPDMVSAALAGHIAEFPPCSPDGLLFHTSTGRPYAHTRYASVVFRRAVRRAGLRDGTTPHDLRHHFASVLLAAGESVVAVAERMGHKNAKLVLETYAHLLPGTDDRTRRAIDGAWAERPEQGDTAQTLPG
jgi:integrase